MSDVDQPHSVLPLLRASLLDEVEELDASRRADAELAVQRRLDFVGSVMHGKKPRLEVWFKRALQG